MSNFDREKFIADKMQEHWDRLQKDGYEVLALFLQGSQNYGTDMYTDEYMSDVDTKAIILPTLDDIVQGKLPISYTIVMPDNSHIDVKDIRVMIDMWEKQNISYLELLYTKYNICNIDYFQELKELAEIRDDITSMHKNQLLRCIQGMSGNKIKALEHRYEGLIDKIDKWGYDEKQLLHIVRLQDFTTQWLRGTSFKECYTPLPATLQLIKDIRAYKFHLDDARDMANEYDSSTCDMVKDYIANHKEYIDSSTKDKLHNIMVSLVKKALIKELKNENSR